MVEGTPCGSAKDDPVASTKASPHLDPRHHHPHPTMDPKGGELGGEPGSEDVPHRMHGREPMLSSYQRRVRLNNAICRLRRRSKQVCGIYVQFKDMVGILTTSDALPSELDADDCVAIFDLSTGDRHQVPLLPRTHFLSSPKLGFTFVACSDPGPAVPPVELHRGRNAGVENGERAHVVMLEETGEKKLVETKILRLTSPTFTYHVDDADDSSLPPGTVLLNGLQVIGLHKRAFRMERKENKGFLSKLTCGPSEAEVSFM
ncbi:hypothetical protein GUITHDRAFT_153586, partial [Guillardia theta CCMP2712]